VLGRYSKDGYVMDQFAYWRRHRHGRYRARVLATGAAQARGRAFVNSAKWMLDRRVQDSRVAKKARAEAHGPRKAGMEEDILHQHSQERMLAVV
jgi:hypothetical protein